MFSVGKGPRLRPGAWPFGFAYGAARFVVLRGSLDVAPFTCPQLSGPAGVVGGVFLEIVARVTDIASRLKKDIVAHLQKYVVARLKKDIVARFKDIVLLCSKISCFSS